MAVNKFRKGKVKIFLCLIKEHIMKQYGGVEF
jgi:hypothetical protein